jgi:hypothetical protein
MNTSVPSPLVMRKNDPGNSGKARPAIDRTKRTCPNTIPNKQLYPEEKDNSAPPSNTTPSIIKNSISGKTSSIIRRRRWPPGNDLFGNLSACIFNATETSLSLHVA